MSLRSVRCCDPAGSLNGTFLVVISGIARIDPARRDEVIASAVDVMTRTRARLGCLSFVCSADLEDPNLLHLFLEWESVEALFALFTPERVTALRHDAEKLGIREVSIRRYEIKSVGPIV